MSNDAPAPTKEDAPPVEESNERQADSMNTMFTSSAPNVPSMDVSGTRPMKDVPRTETSTDPKSSAGQGQSGINEPRPFQSYSFVEPMAISQPDDQRPQTAPFRFGSNPAAANAISSRPSSLSEPKSYKTSKSAEQGNTNNGESAAQGRASHPASSISPTRDSMPMLNVSQSSVDRQMLTVIAPRTVPGATNHPRPVEKAPRSKRRRQTSAGKRWSSAAEKFVREIPPVPYYSDRPVPQRDMRGWIKIIEKEKRTWDRFMNDLIQDDFLDDGETEICRYVLSSMIYETQDPKSAKSQTRQAVNNAIKRELDCPKAIGQSSRGETFRELFRSKAKQAGFITAPLVKTEDDAKVSGMETTGLALSIAAEVETRRASKIATGARLGDHSYINHPKYGFPLLANTEKVSADGVDGLNAMINAAATIENPDSSAWLDTVRQCQLTPAGEVAYWTSTGLNSPSLLRNFVADLVGLRNIFELKRILVDFRWIRRHSQVDENGILHLVKYGYDALLAVKTPALNTFEREGYRLIRNALMLIRPVLQPGIEIEKYNESGVFEAHLATQLYGRLLQASPRFSVISSLLESIRVFAKRPWLRPLNPCFESPKADIAIAVRSGVDAVQSAIAMSKDGSLVLTSADSHNIIARKKQAKRTDNYAVRVWNVDTGKCVSNLSGTHNSSVIRLAITNDRRYVISCAGQQLIFWEILDARGKYIPEITAPHHVENDEKGTVFSMAVFPDNARVAVAHASAIWIWNIKDKKPVRLTDKSESVVCSLDVSSDGKHLASGNEEGQVAVWSITKMQLVVVEKLAERSVFSVSFFKTPVKSGSLGSLQVAFGSQEGLRIWPLPQVSSSTQSDQQSIITLHCDSMKSPNFESVECTSNGMIFSGSDDGIVRLWKQNSEGQWKPLELGNEALERLWSEQRKASVFIAANEDGTRVASSTTKPLIPVWDIGQYEDTVKAQLEESYQRLIPHREQLNFSVYVHHLLGMPLTTVEQGSDSWSKYFEVNSDNDMRCKKPLDLITPGNMFELVLYDSVERSIEFDENIDIDRRCGTFQRTAPNEHPRKGVIVKFKDGGVVFLVVELPPRKA